MSRACLSLVLTTALSIGAYSALAADKPNPADVEKHGTSPGDRYQPSLDVMKDQKVEQPGAKPGVPQLSADEFARAQ